jgi:hypothetical protein
MLTVKPSTPSERAARDAEISESAQVQWRSEWMGRRYKAENGTYNDKVEYQNWLNAHDKGDGTFK